MCPSFMRNKHCYVLNSLLAGAKEKERKKERLAFNTHSFGVWIFTDSFFPYLNILALSWSSKHKYGVILWMRCIILTNDLLCKLIVGQSRNCLSPSPFCVLAVLDCVFAGVCVMCVFSLNLFCYLSLSLPLWVYVQLHANYVRREISFAFSTIKSFNV